jgi:hypothetical protein
MKFRLKGIPLLFSIVILAGLFIARSDNPPFGKTGAPGEGFCGDCHLGGSSMDAEIYLSGLPDYIEPNQTYALKLTAYNPNGLGVKAGFQLVALNSANENAGIMTNASPYSEITSNNLRTYIEHRPAQNFAADDSVHWTFDWTSPAGPFGDDITLYSVVMITNGNDYITGDRMVLTTWNTNLEYGYDLPEITFEIENASCFNDGSIRALVSEGETPYTYQWSNGDTTDYLPDLSPGDYFVTVTDINQASRIGLAVVEQFQEVPEYQISDPSCYQGNDGSIAIMLDTLHYNFQWSNGNRKAINENLSPGNYSLTITDANDCELVLEGLEVFERDSFHIENIHMDLAACPDEMDNQVAIELYGSSPPYSFSWSDGNQDSLRTNLSAGTFELTITDVNECIKFLEIDIPNPIFEINLIGDSTSCALANDGKVFPNINGGHLPYSFLWSNGDTSQTLENISSGDYTLTITDGMGCVKIDMISIFAKEALQIVIDSVQQISESGGGSIDISVSGLSGNYSFQWYNQDSLYQNEEDLTSLEKGSYYLVVTDLESGCSLQSSLIEIFDFTSVSKLEESDCLIYPNPSSDYLNFDCLEIIDKAQIYNASGQLMQEKISSNNQLEVKNYPDGVYILALFNSNEIQLSKFLIIH